MEVRLTWNEPVLASSNVVERVILIGATLTFDPNVRNVGHFSGASNLLRIVNGSSFRLQASDVLLLLFFLIRKFH